MALDVRSLMVTVSACSIALLAALWFGSRGERRDGMAAFLYALLSLVLTTALLALRDRLSYALGVALANALFLTGGLWITYAMAEFAGRKPPRGALGAFFAAALVAGLLLRGHDVARVRAVNATMSLVTGFNAWLALRATRGLHAGARALLCAGSAVMCAMLLLRIGLNLAALRPVGTVRRESWVQGATVLGMLAGAQASALAFLMLQRDRAERALAALNGTLEARVREQVAASVARAKELRRLNAELEHRAASLSEELSETLAQGADDGPERLGVGVGAVLRERFALEAELGRGGMGVVYRALDRATGERVAVKVVGAASGEQLEALRRFLGEAQASAAVPHPSVVFARHIDLTGASLFLVFELVRGHTLAELRRQRVEFAPGAVALLGARLADALAAAHERGVVHRDVKPGNVMLSAEPPAVRLLDFGIARLRDAVRGEGASGDATRSSLLVGTPAYMAPEQLLGEPVHERSDVYALGVLLYELLAGRRPFAAGDGGARPFERVLQRPAPLASVAPSVPAALAACVDRCLLREPDERPSAKQLADELGAIAAREGADDAQLAALAARGRALQHLTTQDAPSVAAELELRATTPARPANK